MTTNAVLALVRKNGVRVYIDPADKQLKMGPREAVETLRPDLLGMLRSRRGEIQLMLAPPAEDAPAGCNGRRCELCEPLKYVFEECESLKVFHGCHYRGNA